MAYGDPGTNPPQQIICGICYQPFMGRITKNNTPRYCSKKCANQRQIPPHIACPICGKLFKPDYKQQYCSVDCYHKSKKVNSPKVHIYDKCLLCQKHYITTGPNQLYCSHKCYTIGRQKTMSKPCGYCGKIIVDIPKIIKKKKYCSYACNNKARLHAKTQNYKIKYRGRNWKEQSEKARIRDNFTCQICGIYQIVPTLTVHHVKPYRKFDGDYKSANELNNLITLCRSCHSRIERQKISFAHPTSCPVQTLYTAHE